MIHLTHCSTKAQEILASAPDHKSLPMQWVFLGRNFVRLRHYEDVFPANWHQIPISEKLQEQNRELRADYLDTITNWGLRYNNLTWWSSRLAERYGGNSSLFHNLCYLKIMLRLVDEIHTELLFITESYGVLELFERLLSDRIEARWLPSRASFEESRQRITNKYEKAWHGYDDRAKERIDLSQSSRLSQLSELMPAKKRFILFTFVDDDFFGEDGKANHRYFGELPDKLHELGHEVVTIPSLYSTTRPLQCAYEWLRHHPGHYLIPDEFYTLDDYQWAKEVVLRQREWVHDKFVFQGMDIAELIMENVSMNTTPSVTEFALHYRLIEKLRSINYQIDTLIIPFENMFFEKPIIMGAHKFMPETQTIGYQHLLSLYPSILCFHTTECEASIAPHPKIIVCNSELTKGQMIQLGFPLAKLHVGPSLRYQHLGKVGELQCAPEGKTVLVVLSLRETATRETLNKLREAFPVDEGIRFFLKHHPLQDTQVFAQEKLPCFMVFCSGVLQDWVSRSSCVVVAPSSSPLEIALLAKPLLMIGSECDFDDNPLEWFAEIANPIHHAAELREQVLSKIAIPEAERERLRQWTRKMISQCVSPLNAETITPFLD